MLTTTEADNTANLPKPANRWLCEAGRNVTSQAREDVILAEALRVLPGKNKWCIECGAWDGKRLSNTFDLVDRQQYQAVLIEGDPEKYRHLCASYPHKDRALLINAYVGWSAEDCLDRFLVGHSVPKEPDLLSLDVDGNDYHIWQAMENIRPKLVLIEYNPTMPNCLDFVQPRERDCHQGSSPAALVRLAKEKGYELIAATDLNLLFVDRTYYGLFDIRCNSLEAIRVDRPNYIFFGYDGTVFLHGECRLFWHELQLSAKKIQVLPAVIRKFPPTYNLLQRVTFRVFVMLTDPKEGMKWLKGYAARWMRALNQ